MTVSDQTNRTSVVGDDTTQEIPFSFPVSATSDIEVRSRVIDTGVESDPLTENSDYTVSLSGDSGGTVTMITTFASTYQIHVKRNTPKTQLLDLEQGGSFNAENIEDALDKNTKLSIENADSLDRTLRFPETDADSIMEELPKASTRAGKFLYFGADGNPSVAESITTGETIISPFGEELIDDDNASAALTTLGFSAYGKTLIDDTTAAIARGTLGLDTDDAVEFAAITSTDIITKGPEIDIRAYGAVGDGDTDDTDAIQDAADAAVVGGTLLIPRGTFKITSTININGTTSIRGLGGHSVIQVNNCDAFNISTSAILGGTEWSNFRIFGVDGINHIAIKAMGTSTFGAYTVGAHFNNIYISNFSYGMYFRSLAHSVISNCFINRVWIGIQLAGSCVNTTISGNTMFLDFFAEGTIGQGDLPSVHSIGIQIMSASDYDPDGATEYRPEDVRVIGNITQGFDIGINYLTALYGTIIANDFDGNKVYGIVFAKADGGLVIRDNWVALSGVEALYGVYGIPQGGANIWPVLIEHNTFTAISSPHALSIGIYIRENQQNVTTRDNYFSGFQAYDILYHITENGVIENNICTSTNPTVSIFVDSPTGPMKVFGNKVVGILNFNPSTSGIELESVSLGSNAVATSTSGTGEDDLRSMVIRADTLEKFRGIHIMASGLKTTGGGNKTIKLYFGDDVISVFPAANDTVAWILQAWITNDNATNLQQVIWQFNNNGTITMGQDNSVNQDTTADVTVKLTGECADAGDTITQNLWLVERF